MRTIATIAIRPNTPSEERIRLVRSILVGMSAECGVRVDSIHVEWLDNKSVSRPAYGIEAMEVRAQIVALYDPDA